MHLSYFGIRVSDLARSADFYMRHFGLRLSPDSRIPEGPSKEQGAVLLFDERSGQRLELNYYPEGTPYAVPYVPGEGWDHLAFRVDDLQRLLEELSKDDIPPEKMAHYDGPLMETPNFRVAYIRDPDGNQVELYELPGSDSGTFQAEHY